MTSGEHQLWDAHMAVLRSKAMPMLFDPQAAARMMVRLTAAGGALGVSLAEAAEAVRRFAEAYPSAMEELRYRTRGVTRAR